MPEKEYYLHDTTRGTVGNSMVWWKHNDHGRAIARYEDKDHE